MLVDPNHAAFPCSSSDENGHQEGLTIREYFAVQCLQGLCANPEFARSAEYELASAAVRRADTLIAQLNQGK